MSDSEHLPAVCREVYAEFGLAMHWAQELEDELATAIMAAWCIDPPIQGDVSYADFERLLEASFGRSLGQLGRKLTAEFRVPPELIARLEATARIRNRLAHTFFRRRSQQLVDSEGAQSLLEEVKQLQRELQAATEEVVRFLERFWAQFRLPGETPRLQMRTACPPWRFTTTTAPSTKPEP